MKPKVSVVIPCFNDGMYIDEAIQSVYKQSYDNIEIIIVDDGSYDEYTKDKIRKLDNESDLRVFFINNQGPAAARNFAIEKATGKYILPLDADDKIHSEYIQKAVEILENDHNIGVVYCEAEFFGARSGKWDLPPYSFERMLLDNIVFITAMFLKKDWEKVGGFCSEFKYGIEDYDFWLSILSEGKEFYKIPETLFSYRIKSVSRSTAFIDNFDKIRETYELIFKRHREFYLNNFDVYNKVMRNAVIDSYKLIMKENEPINEVTNKAANIQKIKEAIKKIPVVGSIASLIYKKIK